MSKTYERAVIQWIPSHCNITGKEEADKLAKKGGQLPQTDYQISYEEAKTVTKGHYYEQWKRLHPKFSAADGHFQLSRSEQVIILRLRTGHNRLRHHMHTRFKLGTTSLYHFGLTAEHVQQECP